MIKKCIFFALLAFPCFSCMAHTTLAEKLVNKYWAPGSTRALDKLLSYAFQAVNEHGSRDKYDEVHYRGQILSFAISQVNSTRTRDQIIVSYYIESRQQFGELIYEYNGYRADVFTKVHGKWKMVLHTVMNSVI